MAWWLTWVLVPLIVGAQSGDLDPSTETQRDESESPVSCTSDISLHFNSTLTCSLVRGGGGDDDEDREDSIKSITICPHSTKKECLMGEGDSVSMQLTPITFNVTVQLSGGTVFSFIVDLRKIVKPRSPQVRNATFNPQNDQTTIHIETPYHEDYLKPSNQLFQYHIWNTTTSSSLTQNVTGETLLIKGEYLSKNTEYQVKVRAIPSLPFEGTWSDWSRTARFYTNSKTQRDESESPFSCTSDISLHFNSTLTCSLVRGGGGDDDEDREDSIKSITICPHSKLIIRKECLMGEGDSVSMQLTPINAFTVSVQLSGGTVFSFIVDLRKIVKPRSPQVRNATFNPQNDQATIHIETPYHEDYLKPSNQLFQYHIWNTTTSSSLTQNVTGETLLIKGEYLSKNTEYQVKVRAIPSEYFEGTWSDWSRTARFYTNSTKPVPLLIVILVISVPLGIAIICSFVVGRKNISRRIHAYMVPIVPATLAPFYRQVKPGVEAMSFKPEQFSHMHIQPMKAAEEPSSTGESRAVSADPSSEDLGDHCLDWDLPAAPDGPGGRRWRSTSDSSTFTGESASTLLSYQSSSADGTYSRPRSRSQSPPTVPHAAEGGRGPSLPGFSGSFSRGDSPEGPEVNLNGPTQPNREADYVTMSSFCQGGPERPRDGD